jgi:2-polyprenyl-3-methyl-5-hydroxy-6-metoxy-1,4-benzoquinol methylase
MTLEILGKTAINNNLRSDVCLCCESTSLTKLGSIKYSRNTSYSGSQITLTETPELWRCDDCHSCFTQNRVTESDSVQLYSLGSSWFSDSFVETKTKETVDLIESFVTPGCKILDVGCANGAMLDHLKKKGAITSGLEYSLANIDELRRKEHTTYSDWSQIGKHFDIITAFDVVEHLYDLESFLDSCFDHLSDDGLLVFMTGDVNSLSAITGKNNWWYVRFPEHVLFPSLKYFLTLEKFEVTTVVKTYPMNLKVHPSITNFMKNVKAKIMSLFLGDFIPSLSLPPDHIIVVLKKISN